MSVISQEMIAKYAEKHALELNDSTSEGIRKNLESWERGEGTMDSRLTDSPETREIFAPLREAYFAAHGQVSSEVAFSNVSFNDPDAVIPTTDGLPPVSTPVTELPEYVPTEQAEPTV